MIRLLTALGAAALFTVPAAAATYSAKPMQASAQRIIARDVVWKCGPAACLAASEASRPAVVCQSLAKRAGLLESFVVDGRAFNAAELDRCNAFAKGASSQALANAR